MGLRKGWNGKGEEANVEGNACRGGCRWGGEDAVARGNGRKRIGGGCEGERLWLQRKRREKQGGGRACGDCDSAVVFEEEEGRGCDDCDSKSSSREDAGNFDRMNCDEADEEGGWNAPAARPSFTPPTVFIAPATFANIAIRLLQVLRSKQQLVLLPLRCCSCV
ncbi:hypothetical protein OIU84_004738 [Salix udensis]|uniref:Uncharacterized protein n=1 Tax=Salix udensis TaxID=889485 RepID=A0AAD6K2X6_9ROSI|nr:hypothetical protein OIU84_004738 [Salix udensis]